MRRAWKAAASAATMIAALGACSSRSSRTADPTTATAPGSTSTVTATTAAVTTSAATTTSSTSTTAAVTTTTAVVAEQVRGAYTAAYNGYWKCLRDPTACDPSSLTASTGPARAKLTDAVNQLRSSDLKVGPDDFGYMVIEGVTVDAGGQSAKVKACWWDTGVVYGPPATAGGDPIVVNNLKVTSRFETTMVLEASQWRISEEVRTGRVEGVNQCPAKGS